MVTPQSVIKARLRTTRQRDLANELGVTEGYICHIVKGRRDAGEKLLEALGLERIVTYRRRKASVGSQATN